MTLIRATCLLRFHELTAELGADGDEILCGAGIDPAAAGQYDRFIPLRGAIDAVELAADVTGTPNFGRRLAALRGIETIGPVGVAAQTAPTLHAAFGIFSTFISAHSPGLHVRLAPDAGRSTRFVEFGIVLDPAPRQRQAIELLLGASLQILRAILGAGYTPLSVHLPHSPLSPRADYVRYFGCTAHFAQPAAGFTIRSVDLRRRLQRNDGIHVAAVTELAGLVDGSLRPVAQAVTQIAKTLIPTGVVTIGVIADHMGMHPRALQRRLASEDTTFATLVDKVRRETAERYLRDTDINLDHLTRLLGYSEQSVLTRSCQRWFGCSPTAYRARHAADADAP